MLWLSTFIATLHCYPLLYMATLHAIKERRNAPNVELWINRWSQLLLSPEFRPEFQLDFLKNYNVFFTSLSKLYPEKLKMTNITGIVLVEKYTALEFFKNWNMNSGQKSNWLVLYDQKVRKNVILNTSKLDSHYS